MTLDADADRSRRLLFAPELAAGTLRRADLANATVREASRSRRVPSGLSRSYQRRMLRSGALSYERETVRRAMAAREAVLGADAAGPPRLLVRLRAGAGGVTADAHRAAHAVLAEAGIPHLVAVAPGPPADPDAEAVELAELRRADVAFAMQGLGASLRKLGKDEVAAVVQRAEERLAERAVAPEVLVAVEPIARVPWAPVAERFSVIAGESADVAWMGFHDTPLWRGEAVWMPAYAPFDGPAGGALEGVRALADRGAALWVPVALDPEAEAADGFAALRAFAAEAAAYATPWPAFLEAVRASR